MELTPFFDFHTLWTALAFFDLCGPFTQTGLLCN